MRRYAFHILRLHRDIRGKLVESYGGSYSSEERAHAVCRWYDRLAWFHSYELVMVEEVEL